MDIFGRMALIGVQGSVVVIILLYFQRRSQFMLPSVRAAVKILLLILVASVVYGNWAIAPHAPTTMRIGKIFVINLPQSTEKLRRFTAQMKRQGMECAVWPGVRIRSWNDPVYRKLVDQGLAKPPQEGTREFGNAGVAAAHIMLWQHLLLVMTRSDELALVFEDDEELHPHFMDRLNEVLQGVQDQPLDHININPLRPAGKLVSKRFGLRKIEMLSYFDPKKMNNLWTSAYAISRTGADILLQELKQRQYDFSNPRTQLDYAVAYAAVSNRRGTFYSLPSQSLSHHDELKSARQDANGYRES